VTARTFKTHFIATTFMQNNILSNGKNLNITTENIESSKEKIQFIYAVSVSKGEQSAIEKIGGYTISLNHENTQIGAENAIKSALAKGYNQLLQDQIDAWAKIWEMRHHYRRRCKSTTRYSFQYFPIESNLFR
jgi:maltose phosphorylase